MNIMLENFRLAGYYPYNPLKGHSMELNRELKGCTPWIKARVPGSVYDDLQNAGLIEDPYYNMNSLKCEWVPDRWWVYITEFDKPDTADEVIELVLEGVDYKAHVFLNGNLLGIHEGMFTPFVKDITSDLSGKNILKIVLESAPDEMGQVGKTSETFTQKARFNYKWDFCVRMIGMGLYRPVYLKTRGKTRIDYYNFCKTSEGASLTVDTDGRTFTSLKYDGKVIFDGETLPVAGKASFDISIPAPKLWNPSGNGEQCLYDLEIKVFDGENVSDSVTSKVGLKTIELESVAGAPESARPYCFVINGQKTFIRGVNIVPLDMQYGLVTRERYYTLVKQIKDMNCNLIRVWGGGLIESEDFYQICDELGIMVWQDFIQSSSGIDNFPSHRPEFLALLERSSVQAAKTKRNHVSLTVFCGGNELMFPNWRPVDESVENIAMLKNICDEHCPQIPFFPSTPSGELFAPSFEDYTKNHDVHGEWTYRGVEAHYTYFNDLKCLAHTEYGVDGITNYSAIERTMPKDLHYVCDYDEDMYWRHRGEWWNTYKRDTSVFGEIKTLETQSELSQFLQAEGLRYALDSHRRKSSYTSASIVWQANEPYPNGSCTSLIDYYGEPKLAYYAARNSNAMLNLGLEYSKLVYDRSESIKTGVYLSSLKDTGADIEIKAYQNNVCVKQLSVKAKVDRNKVLHLADMEIPAEHGSVMYQLTATDSDGEKFVSYILLLVKQADGFCSQQEALNFCKLLKGNN